MTDRQTTTTALAAVDELTQVLAWLAASLLPGTTKPYRAPQISEDTRAARAIEDRLYRQAAIIAGTIPLGESPPPCDLAVMDLLSEILVAADDMAGKVTGYAQVIPLQPATSAFADPGPYLAAVRQHLAAAARYQPNILSYVETRCDSLIAAGYGQLGIFGDGQVLRGAVCPWCDGRTEHAVRGEATLRVKAVLPDGVKAISKVAPEDVDWFVVCHGLNCAPSTADCGTWLRGRPAWNLRNEDKFLAKRLEKSAS